MMTMMCSFVGAATPIMNGVKAPVANCGHGGSEEMIAVLLIFWGFVALKIPVEYQKALMMTLHSIWLQMMYYGCALLCETMTVEDQIDAVLLCVCCFGGIVIWYHTKSKRKHN